MPEHVEGSGTEADPWILTTPPGSSEFDAWRAVAQKTSYKVFAEKVPGGKELIEKALSVK